MPPRYVYWTIVVDGVATAFRAREREELLPTFTQLRRKDPSATLKWFARGRLWDSPRHALESSRTLAGRGRTRPASPSRRPPAHPRRDRSPAGRTRHRPGGSSRKPPAPRGKGPADERQPETPPPPPPLSPDRPPKPGHEPPPEPPSPPERIGEPPETPERAT